MRLSLLRSYSAVSLFVVCGCASNNTDQKQSDAAATGAPPDAGPIGDSGSAPGYDAPVIDSGSSADGGDAETPLDGGGAADVVAEGAPATDGGPPGDAQGSEAGAGAVYPQPGMLIGPGVLPPKVANSTYLGKLIYDHGGIVRDLGFSGVVNGKIVWTFGDSILLKPGGSSTFCSSDSVALGDFTHPLLVHDTNVSSAGCPLEWIPWDPAEQAKGGISRYGEGGTNVIEFAPNQGLVWFLKNDRGATGTGIVGAGVATVAVGPNGPVATRPDDTMWNSFEPLWGDIGVTYNALDQNAYVFGHGPSTAQLSNYVYLAKVPAARALDVSAYQYWDQSTGSWGTQRLANGQLGTINVSTAQAIFPKNALGQSNAFWSNYYNTWMFVYGADVGYTDIQVMTAPKLEGPWTKGFTVASTCPNNMCSAIRYAIAPHPEYDLSGKTIFVTWTDSNNVYGVRIQWQ